MESGQPKKIRLDDPDLQSRLRYVHRSSTYIRRPSNYSSELITDVRASALGGTKPDFAKPVAPAPVSKPELPTRRPQRVDIMSRPSASMVHEPRTSRVADFPIKSYSEKRELKPEAKPLPTTPKVVDRPSKPKKNHRKIGSKLKKQPKEKSVSSEPKQGRFKKIASVIKPTSWQQAALYSAAVILLIIGGYVSFSGWQANRQVEAQADHLQKVVNDSTDSNDASTSSDKKPAMPSTKPVSKNTIADYHVASSLPRYIKIPKINVFARVLQTGVDSDGHLGVPPNIYDTSWYTGSSEPGGVGAMLIDGHLDGYNATGVFWNLHKLTKGDKIQIERGDGKTFTYKVVKTKSYKTGNIPMASALVPVVDGKPGLNLITCSGDLDTGTWQYKERLIVYATQI